MRAGEQIPPMLDSIGSPISLTPPTVGVKLDEWDADHFAYWTRFENLLGERFEVRNYPDRPGRPSSSLCRRLVRDPNPTRSDAGGAGGRSPA